MGLHRLSGIESRLRGYGHYLLFPYSPAPSSFLFHTTTFICCPFYSLTSCKHHFLLYSRHRPLSFPLYMDILVHELCMVHLPLASIGFELSLSPDLDDFP